MGQNTPTIVKTSVGEAAPKEVGEWQLVEKKKKKQPMNGKNEKKGF